MRTLWDFVTEEEIETLREHKRGVDEAQKELARLRAVRAEIDLKLTMLASQRAPDIAAAAARYLGEKAAPARESVTLPADSGELKNALLGLQRRVYEQEQAVARARASFKQALLKTLERARSPVAAEYIAAAKKLEEMWIIIDGAEKLATQSPDPAGQIRHVAPEMDWSRALIPGVDIAGDATLHKSSRTNVHGSFVFSGVDAGSRGLGHDSLRRLSEVVRSEIGEWPLDRRN